MHKESAIKLNKINAIESLQNIMYTAYALQKYSEKYD